ncbi:MAG: cobyric acid synthase [Actinobacteria bacterium]|nr:cobyric acid synthase [Actinomycetota bacterium]
MTAKVLMVQGTSSSVGKSLLVAGLCRLFHQEGYRVAPFKAQNMALNAAVTEEGLEIGRATAAQAEAAGIEPSVDMNPILLKPEGDSRSQIVLMGRPLESLPARAYYERKKEFWEAVSGSLARLRDKYEVVVIEGAGSPAEINLREGDLVNMRVALHAQAPVLLVGDIDRGGVFASLLGTLMLLAPEEKALVKGLVINKFRGDVSLLGSGLRMLEDRAGMPVLGVVPYLRNLLISEEDSAGLEATSGGAGLLDVAVIRLPRISNFDDFDLLAAEPAVSLHYVADPAKLGRPDLVILPGSKGTVSDLQFLRETGLARAITALTRTGTAVLGICGGYQMMGETILDPEQVESPVVETAGMGLLPAITTFVDDKRTVRVSAVVLGGTGPFAAAAGQEISAYEIHMGTTVHRGEPAFQLSEWGTGGPVGAGGSAGPPTVGYGRLAPVGLPTPTPGRADTAVRPYKSDGGEGDPLPPSVDGCVTARGALMGTYFHGLFENPCLRRALVNWLLERRGLPPFQGEETAMRRETDYDRLAETLRHNLDLSALHRIVGLGGL